MKKLDLAIAQQAALVVAAQGFANVYGTKMPEDFPGILGFYGSERPTYSLYLPSNPEPGNREKLLAVAGEVFGRDGWKRKLGHDATHFNWTKQIEGVDVTISQAEPLANPQDGSPVLPRLFPLLLPDFRKQCASTRAGEQCSLCDGHPGAHDYPWSDAEADPRSDGTPAYSE